MTQTLKIGYPITVGIGYGSIGLCLKPESEKEKGIYILTNGHVVADDNQRINIGVKVYAGEALEGSTQKNKVKGLTEIATVFKGLREFNHDYGYVDWALCKVLPLLQVTVDNSFEDQLITKFVDPDLVKVIKYGACSHKTEATVDNVDYRSHIDYLPDYPQADNIGLGKGVITFQGQYFVMKGDSGSIALTEDYKAMALLFAGDQQISSLGLPLRRILQSLQDKTKMSWQIAPNGNYKDGIRLS